MPQPTMTLKLLGQTVEVPLLTPAQYEALYSVGLLDGGNAGSASSSGVATTDRAVMAETARSRTGKTIKAARATKSSPRASRRARGARTPTGYWSAAKAWGKKNGFVVNDRGAPSKALLAKYSTSADRKKTFPTFKPS